MNRIEMGLLSPEPQEDGDDVEIKREQFKEEFDEKQKKCEIAISKLDPLLKSVAEKYLQQGSVPESALIQALTMDEINHIQDQDLRELANKYLGSEYNLEPMAVLNSVKMDISQGKYVPKNDKASIMNEIDDIQNKIDNKIREEVEKL